MEQYNDWQDENENISPKYPINDYYISPMQNQEDYMQARIISPNYDNMYTPPRQNIQMREEKIKNDYNNNYVINNRIINDNYEYPQYQNIQVTKQYYNKRKNEDNYNINNNNMNSSLKKYESSDGVLRGYTNNYSFYVSGSSQIKPKVTINNQYNNKNYNNVNNQNNINNPNKRQFIYKNSPSPQSGPRPYQKIIYSNNNNSNINNVNSNYGNRQINQNENSSYIIRMVEKEPVIYNQPNQEQNFNNNYEDDDIYYYDENENRNIEQRTYRGPIVQRRMVKRVVEKEPFDSKRDYYVFGPNDNMRNANNKYSNQKIQQKPIYQKVNNYNNNTANNNNYKRFYSNHVNENINNINQRNDYFESYPLKRTNTPNAPRPITRQYSNYSRPVVSRQQRIMDRSPNMYGTKNSNNSISYPTRNNQYNAYPEQSDYFVTQTESNSSRYKTPFMYNSPGVDNDNDNNVYVIPMGREREYTSRTELQNQGGYELEYENEGDNDDDVYEVPEQYNNNYKGFYIEKRQNISNRPFTRVNHYSQNQRDGRKYGVYTQTMAINKNYNRNYDEEYEVDRRNIRYIRNNNRNNYSVPKIMKPINDVQRLVRNKREYSAFERSLRNIRDNEEEIELENEERNNKVRIKTSGSNNHRLFISNNSRDHPSKQYKTYTELQTDRPQGYILEDIDDDYNPEEYRIRQNNRKINRNNNNIRVVQRNNENKFQPIPPPRVYRPEEKNYYEDENIENFQKIKAQNNEEIEDEDNDEEDQMYDTNQLMAAKEGNLRIIHKKSEEGFKQNPDIQNSDENDNDIEGEEHDEEIIQKTNTNINTNTEEDLYQNDDIPQDRDEPMPIGKKNVKNIQTEINEKYYDNQGNYLGEKKIITTKQVPINNENQMNKMNQINNNNYGDQQEEGEYQEEEEQEEYENEDEYTPYQSNNKKFKKRGDINNKNAIESKYHSYFGDSNNNVYYEIKGVSGEINKEDESKNEEETEKRNYKEPMVQVKNITFGIQSENLCVPGQDNENEEKDNIEEKGNNDEKEADEQGIDENVIIDEEDEEQNNINDKKENNENLKINQEIKENIGQDQHINDNDNDNVNINEDENYIDKNNIANKEDKINEINEMNNNEEYENKNINENENFDNIEYNNNNEEHNYNDEENIDNNHIEENYDNNINNEMDIKNSNNNEYEENNINININNDENNINKNIYENNNIIKKGNHFNYEEEQIVEENEEEIENENIQKDEVEEAMKEGLVDIEENDNYNYEEIEGEEGEEEEKKEEYIEEDNINKEDDENLKEN